MFILGHLAFGIWDFSDEATCYSVEHPDYKAYKGESPAKTDPDKYVGLKVINVTTRFRGIVISGFIIEFLILSFIILSFCYGRFSFL